MSAKTIFEHETVFPMLGGYIKVTVRQQSVGDEGEVLSTTCVFFGRKEADFKGWDNSIEVFNTTEWAENPVVNVEQYNRMITEGGRAQYLKDVCANFAMKAVGDCLYAQDAEIDELRQDL